VAPCGGKQESRRGDRAAATGWGRSWGVERDGSSAEAAGGVGVGGRGRAASGCGAGALRGRAGVSGSGGALREDFEAVAGAGHPGGDVRGPVRDRKLAAERGWGVEGDAGGPACGVRFGLGAGPDVAELGGEAGGVIGLQRGRVRSGGAGGGVKAGGRAGVGGAACTVDPTEGRGGPDAGSAAG